MPKAVVCALYKFVAFDDFRDLQKPLLDLMSSKGLRGTILLAREGINGTVAGSREGIDALLGWLRSDERFSDIVHKESFHDRIPFHRTKVRLKKEIVTMGMEGVDPLKIVGTYVKPKDWNTIISDPDVTLIDSRNAYEYHIGSFRGAVNPETDSFRQFPEFVKDNLDTEKDRKVAMFCTGGIRCEKSTACLK